MKMQSVFLSLMLASTSAFAAAPAISNIPLASGDIKPTQMLLIPLDKLVSNVSYDVTCNIVDLNNGNNQAIMSVYPSVPGSFYTISLNGMSVGTSQMKLNQVNNTLVITNMWNANGALKITNADQDDTLTVTNCVAVAEGAKSK